MGPNLDNKSNESYVPSISLGDILTLFSPSEAEAVVIPKDEKSKERVEKLKSGSAGSRAKQAYNLSHELLQPVEVETAGPFWEEIAKTENKSVDFLNNSTLLGAYDLKNQDRISLNPSLDRYYSSGLTDIKPETVLAHELGHFLHKQSGAPMNSITLQEEIADTFSGYGVANTQMEKNLFDLIIKNINDTISKQKVATKTGATTGAASSFLKKSIKK